MTYCTCYLFTYYICRPTIVDGSGWKYMQILPFRSATFKLGLMEIMPCLAYINNLLTHVHFKEQFFKCHGRENGTETSIVSFSHFRWGAEASDGLKWLLATRSPDRIWRQSQHRLVWGAGVKQGSAKSSAWPHTCHAQTEKNPLSSCLLLSSR